LLETSIKQLKPTCWSS